VVQAKQGTTVKDVSAAAFIAAFSKYLKQTAKIDLPEWHDLVKTGTHKELCPQDPDWYYVRAASMARKVYLRGGTGIGAFTKVYGSRRRKDCRARHFHPAAKGVLRHVLQELEKLDIVGRDKAKKGRWITKNGQHLLDTVAAQAAKPAKAK